MELATFKVESHIRFLPSICTVDSHSVNGGWVIAKILYMSENVSTAILRDEVSQVCSQSHICHRRLVVAPFLYWEALEQDETLSIENLSPD